MMLSFLLSFLFIISAILMIIFALLKSKRDEDRKKKQGLKVTPTKRVEVISPTVTNSTSNTTSNPNTPYSNVRVRFDLDTPIVHDSTEHIDNEIDFDDLYHQSRYSYDNDDDGGGWGLDDADLTLLGIVNYDNNDNIDSYRYNTNDTYANRYMLNYSKHKVTTPSSNTKQDHEVAIDHMNRKIANMNKAAEQKLYELDQRMNAEAQLLKMKTDEERHKFLQEKQKEEENKKRCEKVAEEMKEIMAINSHRNSGDSPAVVEASLDVVRMRALYSQSKSMMKGVVSPSFNDTFKSFEAFNNDVDGLFDSLTGIRNQIQSSSGKGFHDLGSTGEAATTSEKTVLNTLLEHFAEEMKEQVTDLFENHKKLISRLEHDALVRNFKVLIANKKGKHIQHLESALIKVELSAEIVNILEDARNRIENLNDDQSKQQGDEFAEENIICDTVLIAEKAISKAAKSGPQGFMKVLLSLLEYTVSSVKACNTFHNIPAFAFIVYGIFRTLPQQHKLKVSEIVRSFLAQHSDLISKVLSSESAQTPEALEFDKNCNRKHHDNVLVLYGVLVASNEQFPLNVNDGWAYLVKCGKAFSRYVTNSKSTDKLQDAKLYCTALTLSLRTYGKALKTQIPKHKELLDTILQSVKGTLDLDGTDEGKLLIDVISQLNATGYQSLKKDSSSNIIDFKNQQPVVMKKRLIIRECYNIKAIVKVINEERKSNSNTKVAFDKVRSIRGFLNAFNSLEDVKARNGIISKIKGVLTEVCYDERFEDFAYIFIAETMINDKIEAEQFINTDPKNTFKYALLTHELCNAFPKFQVIIKSQFYDRCPLTVPVISDKNHGTEWENKMMNVLSTYVVVMVYLGTPFNIKEGWNLLASIINYYSDPLIKTIPSYVISALDIFIGIAGEYLYKNYDQQRTIKLQKMIKYLTLLSTTIIPKCSGDTTKNLDSLKEKIKSVINSRGSTWINYYSDEDLNQLISQMR